VRAIRLRWWETALLIPFGLLGVLFLLAGHLSALIVLVAVGVVALTSRATILERNRPGGYARTRGWLTYIHVCALFAIYGTIVYFFFEARREHWSHDVRGIVAVWAMAGLAFYLVRDILRLAEGANRWLLGSDMEREVARRLDPLREKGWIVTHDIKKDRGGNVDHFVSGPNGAYVIETKRGSARAADRNQAIWNAVWAKEKFGLRWVTAVLCVGTDPPAEPLQQGHAWVVGANDLGEFLRRPRR
jgi:nuclease-like protein